MYNNPKEGILHNEPLILEYFSVTKTQSLNQMHWGLNDFLQITHYFTQFGHLDTSGATRSLFLWNSKHILSR